MYSLSTEIESVFRGVPSIRSCFKNIRYNMEKINTDNLLRDNFEMFTVSQLHNAFLVVVQFAKHCWLSLAAGIFLHHIEWCCQNSVLLKTLQDPANKCPPSPYPPHVPLHRSPARAGPACWKAAQAVWPLSKPRPLWKSPHASAGLSVSGVMGSPLWPGVGKHTWP